MNGISVNGSESFNQAEDKHHCWTAQGGKHKPLKVDERWIAYDAGISVEYFEENNERNQANKKSKDNLPEIGNKIVSSICKIHCK